MQNLYDYGRLKKRLIETGESRLQCSESLEYISVLKLFGELIEVTKKMEI